MPERRQFGPIPGVPEGTAFASRRDLSAATVHRPLMRGIWGLAINGGADSIVLSGGYEDDRDYGDTLVYTGEGGRDPTTKRQISDQTLTGGNLALYQSMLTGEPVRVIRGADHKSPFSPVAGYRYDGVFHVVDSWEEKGVSGHKVWRFRLVKAGAEDGKTFEAPAEPLTEGPKGNPEPGRKGSWVVRVIRNTEVAEHIKRLYNHTCQVCGVRLETAGGPYSETAHIRPLGRPHDGPDVPSNCLCLCPNDHVRFDRGVIAIQDDLSLLGVDGELYVVPGHAIDPDHLRYHRDHYFDPVKADGSSQS
jgi:putative restriction endonuclease